MIKNSILDGLIASGRIVKFYRSTGWVFIGFTGDDRIRGEGGNYNGTERRSGRKAVRG